MTDKKTKCKKCPTNEIDTARGVGYIEDPNTRQIVVCPICRGYGVVSADGSPLAAVKTRLSD